MTLDTEYDPVNGQQGRKKGVKYAVAGVASVILVAAVIGVAVTAGKGNGTPDETGNGDGGASESMKAVQAICAPTDYKETCVNSISSASGNTTDPKDLIQIGFQAAINQVKNAISNSSTVKEAVNDPRTKQALQTCQDMLDYTIDDLENSFRQLGTFDVSKIDDYVSDLQVWMSGAVTFQETCLDGFANTTGDAGEKMQQILKTSRELTSNGLAMITEISLLISSLNVPGLTRRLMSNEEGHSSLPKWVDGRKRSLLDAMVSDIKADVIVAQDGSGKYKTINECLQDIPKKNTQTFVVYIKEGVYAEKVFLDKKMTNVMMIGDGPDKTVITGSLNFIDGVQTCNTATFSEYQTFHIVTALLHPFVLTFCSFPLLSAAVVGANFMAKDIKFENTAGAEKHQAVALRVQSDMSIFYNCEMDAYQDTLYTHAHRQYYRDCTIAGTIDFIFGDAPAVFQNCKMVVRKPLENQQCIVTASGRSDRRSASAIVLQNCTITADPEYYPLREINKAYLGRPWKNFSRTIVMQSEIDDLIQPQGWLPWLGDAFLSTCFYAEYGNRGPGSGTSQRAKWRGIKKITPQHILDFTPGRFFKGDNWIRASGVPYSPGMMAV
ncbi:hypothetical protein MLD38_016355 [Melastoma candidum]|uniref:Uncharacterized protein n=1 Tax=Melastoma candidum TaxID=119954 RepID=A0ACB9RKC0_9MYRT|nr:hypothetical protein MLD38_016355 [Melastoma candidum]